MLAMWTGPTLKHVAQDEVVRIAAHFGPYEGHAETTSPPSGRALDRDEPDYAD